MELKKIYKHLCGLAMIFCCSLCFFTPVFADGSSIEISPASKSIKLDPGASYSDILTVKNIGNEGFNFSVKISPYQVTNETYDPIYSINNNFTKIVDWISVPEGDIYVAPGEYADVPYTIEVPMDVPSGAQFAVISAVVGDPSNESAVQFLSSIGMVVSAEISGNTRTGGEILSKNIEGFLLQPPIRATFSFSNTGNINSTATCTMRVSNFFNGSEVFSNAEDPKTFLVMPDTTRSGEISWNGSPFLGVFRVNLNLTYLEENVTVSKIVILCPLWFLLAVIIFIIVAIILAVVKFKKRRPSSSRRSKSFGF